MKTVSTRLNIGLQQDTRKEIAHQLGNILASTYALYLKTQYFHWNVEGPFFQALHPLFEKQYRDLSKATDQLAERIRALGFYSPGSFSEFAKMSSVSEKLSIESSDQMLHELIEGHETLLRECRELTETLQKNQDHGTLNLISERIFAHEKTAWILRSNLRENFSVERETFQSQLVPFGKERKIQSMSSPVQESLSNDMERCARECAMTHSILLRGIQACIHQGGEYVHPTHLSYLLNGLEITQTCETFIVSASPYLAQKIIEVTSEICNRCAESCDSFKGDIQMKAIADACRACASSCQLVTKSREVA